MSSLEELAEIFYGKDYKMNPSGDSIPIIGTGGLMGYTSLKLNSGPAILTGRKGSINKPIYLEGDFWNVDTIFCVKAKQGIDTKWLFYNFLNTDLSKLNEATGVPSVSVNNLYRLKFNYFEYPQQRKIAKILSTCDTVIEKTESTIAKYKAIKQGMMHDLFTRGVDILTGKLRPKYGDAPELYKDSELGWIPNDWEVKRLEEITTKIGDGIHTTPKYVDNSEYHFINGNNLINGKIIISNITNCISESEYKTHYRELSDATILYSINGTIGNIAFYDGETVVLGKSAAYICFVDIKLMQYVYNILQTECVDEFYRLELTGSTISNLSLASIRSTPILLPLEDEFKEINKRLYTLLDKIKREQSTLAKYKQIKTGLMQDLLSGKVEV